MNSQTKSIILRCILNSCGDFSVEAELTLTNGFRGIASAPVAIKPGRREKPRSHLITPGHVVSKAEIDRLTGLLKNKAGTTQQEFDTIVSQHPFCQDFGSDITLALSLAFARASASASGLSLTRYLAATGNFHPRMPHPLVNIFSGGIHGLTETIPFQQIMIIPRCKTFYEDVAAALHIYQSIEQTMRENDQLLGYSASSGMLVQTDHYQSLLEIVTEHINRLDYSSTVSIGLDVAAEHLKLSEGKYQFASQTVESDELLALYQQLLARFNIKYLEDPFDASDSEAWRSLNSSLEKDVYLIGDDLFATNALYVNQAMANGILLKMKQAGSLSATLKAASTAQERGMALCVSHRSCETEDTTMCDLAVALGADLVKIGGPRRGDRTAKYNQLLRLAEEWPENDLTPYGDSSARIPEKPERRSEKLEYVSNFSGLSRDTL